MDRIDDILKTLDIISTTEKLLKIFECIHEIDNLTNEEIRSCMKLLICCCDESHLVGIKNRLRVLTG